MKAENTLQIMMDFYGDLFYTRQLCLDHLFCTIGNGYEWKNGELIDTDEDERVKRYKFKKDIKKAKPAFDIEQRGLQQAKVAEMTLRAKALMNPKMLDMMPTKWYPIAEEYSYICNYPEDIKPDWLAILEECKEMLKADGIEVPENRGYVYPEAQT